MEFVEVMKVEERMCEYYDRIECCKCPLGRKNNGKQINCPTFITTYPEKAEEIIMKWAEEHPVKTNRQVLEEVLKEKFGDIFNVDQFGCNQFKNRHCVRECGECEFYNFWNREYKEVSKDADGGDGE